MSIVAFFYALFILPETHGKKLSDIENYFNGSNKKRKPVVEKNGTKDKKENNVLMMQSKLKTISEAEVMLKEDKPTNAT